MFGFRRRRAPTASEVVDEIRRTIVRLDDQRRIAARAAGRALVNQAEVRRACSQQLSTLAAAFGEAENAETLARRAAATARRDDDPTEAEYERTATGLVSVQELLGAAAEPIHRVLGGAEANVEQARQVLVRAREVLDEQVREQVRLLQALERAERARRLRLDIRRDNKTDTRRDDKDDGSTN